MLTRQQRIDALAYVMKNVLCQPPDSELDKSLKFSGIEDIYDHFNYNFIYILFIIFKLLIIQIFNSAFVYISYWFNLFILE